MDDQNQNLGGIGAPPPPPPGGPAGGPPPPPPEEDPHEKILEALARIEEKLNQITAKLGA